ncbi:flagellar hook-length control protein FliK [Salinisphaera dokdonensis CL-ES53]|uniref:Flagellar hook-length control protein FliK n=1 Tax=Salinisphaera dokdonensis CL-ES53 TaxID=1304272 RepID=A0ABV2AZ55_9GAMM
MSVELMRPAATTPTDSGRSPQTRDTPADDGGVSFGTVLAGQRATNSAPEGNDSAVADARKAAVAKTADAGKEIEDPAQAIERQRGLASAHRHDADTTDAPLARSVRTSNHANVDNQAAIADGDPRVAREDKQNTTDEQDLDQSAVELSAHITPPTAEDNTAPVARSPNTQSSPGDAQTAALAAPAGSLQAPIDPRNATLVPDVEAARAGQGARIDSTAQSRVRSDARLTASPVKGQATEAMTLDALQAEASASDDAARLAPTIDRLFAANGERFKLSDGRTATASNIDFTSLSAASANSAHASPAPAAMASPALPSPMLAAAVNAPLGSEAWKQAVNQQALRLSHFGDGSAELTLYPRELGQLHVSLKMGEQAQLHFVSAHADVRAAVEAALPQLRHAFADSGIALGQASVSDQGQNPEQDPGTGSSGTQAGATAEQTREGLADNMSAGPIAITTLAGRTVDGGIDIFA